MTAYLTAGLFSPSSHSAPGAHSASTTAVRRTDGWSIRAPKGSGDQGLWAPGLPPVWPITQLRAAGSTHRAPSILADASRNVLSGYSVGMFGY